MKTIMGKNVDTEGLFCLITERDCPDFLQNSGAIIGEMYTRNGSFDDVVERAKFLGDKYGKTYIAKVEIIGTLEDIEIIE